MLIPILAIVERSMINMMHGCLRSSPTSLPSGTHRGFIDGSLAVFSSLTNKFLPTATVPVYPAAVTKGPSSLCPTRVHGSAVPETSLGTLTWVR